MKTAKHIGNIALGPREEWSDKPMATMRPGLDIRPGWRYLDHDGDLIVVDGIFGIDGCSAPVAEVRYHRISDGTKHRVLVRFAREHWRAAPAAVEAEDQRATRQPSGVVIVYGVVLAFVLAALVVLWMWW